MSANNLEVKIVRTDEKTNEIITYIIPQKDNTFINLLGVEIDFNKAITNVILFMSNIDTTRINKFDIALIIDLLANIKEKFPGYNNGNDISSKISQLIDDIFSPSFWKSLSSSIDCGYLKMDKRKFPYFNINDQRWKEINIKNNGKTRDSYPAEFNGEVQETKAVLNTQQERREDWRVIEEKVVNLIQNLDTDADTKEIEKQVAQAVKYRPDFEKKEVGDFNGSNYFAFEILEPQFYPNLEEYKIFVLLLCKAGFIKLAIKLLLIMPLSFNLLHIIKCDWFWKLYNELIFNEHIKNYVIYYAMYALKLEEIKSYYRVPHMARFIFSLEEAQLISNNIPSIGIDKHALIHLMEPLGFKSSYMPFFLEGKRSINSLEVFKQRLSIACNGLLDDFDLSEFNAILSGSILVPCVATNPLEKRFENIGYKNTKKETFILEDLFDRILNSDLDEEQKYLSAHDISFNAYLECFYPSYKSIKDEELKNFIEPIQTEKEYEAQKFEDLNSTTKNYPDDEDHAAAYGILSDLDISIHTPTFEEFKICAYKLYEKLRLRVKNNNSIADQRIYIKRIRRGSNFKYSLYGPGINRPIDLFWITKSPDTFVEQFHLGVVRMHWNGKQINIMQSALSALLTGINHDYRWMSCNKAPVIPVIKYAQRGYTTPLNKFERPILVEYISGNKEWCNSIITQTMANENIFSPVMLHNLFFMPEITNSGIRFGLKKLDDALMINCNKCNITNNGRVRWNPINSSINGINLEYYNESRNSVASPSIETINKIIDQL